MIHSINCKCQSTGEVDHSIILSYFEELRRKCDALKFFVPDDLYANWKKAEECLIKNPQADCHRSILTLALERGCLGKVTSPVHRYLLNNMRSLKKQYKNDLKEKWILEASPVERHKKSRSFKGKLVELKAAEWLEANVWKINNLEAWNGNVDIEATDPGNSKCCMEVKYIGQENDDFLDLLKSLRGENSASSFSPYVACNYALFRIYEAAKQLEQDRGGNNEKVVIIVIDATTWYCFKFPLMNNWMKDWEYKLNFNKDSVINNSGWQIFYNKQKAKEKYKDIETEMSNVVTRLSQIKIMIFKDWELCEKLTVCPNGKSFQGYCS